LFINFLVQVPLAIALGFDNPSPGLMERKPRPLSQPVLSRSQWIRLIFMGLLTAFITLAVETTYTPVSTQVAATMGFTVFALCNVTFALGARSEFGTVLNREILSDRRQLELFGLSLLLTYLATELNFFQRSLGTVSLSSNQWLICIVFAIALLLVDEVVKFFMRRSRAQAQPAGVAQVTGATTSGD
jgi:Ca2+-transporting ATPase